MGDLATTMTKIKATSEYSSSQLYPGSPCTRSLLRTVNAYHAHHEISHSSPVPRSHSMNIHSPHRRGREPQAPAKAATHLIPSHYVSPRSLLSVSQPPLDGLLRTHSSAAVGRGNRTHETSILRPPLGFGPRDRWPPYCNYCNAYLYCSTLLPYLTLDVREGGW